MKVLSIDLRMKTGKLIQTATSAFILLLIFFAIGANAQILNPTKWEFEVSKKQVAPGEELDLVFKARIEQKWYLYSSDFDPDLGPLLTTFEFEPNDSYELVGEIRPINPSKGYDDIFEGEYTYFKGNGEFRQTVKILKSNPVIKGTIEYQVCSDVDGRCINLDADFVFEKISVSGQADTDKTPTEKPTDREPKIPVDEFKDDIADAPKTQDEKIADREANASTIAPVDNNPLQRGTTSLLAFMLIAFLGGIAAVMTPCVYPMIPMTVAFFSKNTGSRFFAFAYGLSIIFIFTVIGISITLIFGGDVWNKIATNPIINIGFFLIFFIFALSFFGLFDITLPNRFVNKVDSKADRGGLIGVFFMALTLVVVSFSCTAPIASFILIESTQGHLMRPAIGMFAFSLAFAVPFTLFAIFPGWLNNLPKSGGWLNSVKVVIGFLELALGLKFLMIADQVYKWGILNRDVYLAIWIVLFTMIGFYVLGKFRMPHDSKVETVSIPRLLIAIVVFSFVIYMIPGLFGAPLKQLAGWVPPMNSQTFRIGDPGPQVFMARSDEMEVCEEPKYAEMFHLPYGLQGYFDYHQAVACAQEINKPLFIDFTGHGCANCWEMEEKVWSDPRVLNLMRQYVVVALYVDDRTTLPENKWYESEYDGKIKKTIGRQNADLQISRFSNNAQPFYVLLDTNERTLVTPKGYDLNIDNFIAYLQAGLDEFEKRGRLDELARIE
jgi:thiol:disulfide interchange protein